MHKLLHLSFDVYGLYPWSKRKLFELITGGEKVIVSCKIASYGKPQK